MHALNPQTLSNLLPDEVTIDIELQFRDDTPMGEESYADITVNEGNILSGHLDAYCIDIDTPVGATETQLTTKVVSLYDELPDEVVATGRIETPENLDLVGWIINQGFAGKDSAALGGSGVFTFGDVQAAIWTLLGDDNFNANGPDIRPVDQARVDLIVELAQANGEDFIPSFDYTTIFGEQVTGQAGVLLFPDNNVNDANPFDRQPFIVGVELAKLGDFVFEDSDRDGVQDAGEQGIDGVEVKLLADLDGDGEFTDVIETTTTGDNPNTTDVVESGYYEFTTLAGDYKVMFTEPENFEFTTQDAGGDDGADSDADPTNGITDVITLAGGEFNPTVDAGVVSLLAGLGDTVFLDSDRDGIQDAGEQGVAGVTVDLTGAGADGEFGTADDITGTTTTDADGMYAFTDLVAGDYKVTFSDLPEGFEFTTQDVGGDDAADSDADPTTGMSQVVTLAPGEFNPTLDAGIVEQLAGLGDKVFEDTNRNGIQDAGEIGVTNVTVELTGAGADGEFGTADDITGTTTTDADGMYAFNDLVAGDYKVTFSDLPENFVFTQANVGADDAADSDADPTNGMTQVVSLAPGEFNPTLDAGIFQLNEGISIEKFVNGDNADIAAEAVAIAAGDEVTFTYAVKNVGEVAFAAADVVVTDDNGTAGDTSDDFNPAFVGGDLNGNSLLDVGETWLYSESQTAQNLSTVIDFEGFAAGTVIDDEYADLGITVSATGGSGEAMIFDSANPTGGDFDLATDNQGNILIISEDGDASDPDDNWSGGTITFDFDTAVDVDSISFVDIEEAGGTVKSFDASGILIDSQSIFVNGDNGQSTLIIDDADVSSLEVFLKGSGSISGLELGGGLYKNVGSVVAGSVSDEDHGFYENPVAPAPKHVLIEAEDMHLNGYKVEHVGNDVASGGEVIKLKSHDGHASTHFTGHSGYYQVDVAYYDENDGHSMGKVKIGGETIDAWTFDQHLGSRFADADNRVVRTVSESIYIEQGEQIKLSGWKDSAEFARFDAIKFTEVAAPTTFHYEAEDLHLNGYKVEHLGDHIASGGEAIRLKSRDGHASVNFDGPTGEYDILVGYFDENDGRSMGKVKVGDEIVGNWTFNEHTSSWRASADNFREFAIEDVHIEAGEQIKLSGWRNGKEFARFDYIKVVGSESLGAGNGPTTPALEDTDLFAYASNHASGLIQAGVVTDALI